MDGREGNEAGEQTADWRQIRLQHLHDAPRPVHARAGETSEAQTDDGELRS